MVSVPSTRTDERAGPRFHSDSKHQDIPFLVSEDQRKIRHIEAISIRNMHINTTRNESRHRMSGNGTSGVENDPTSVRKLNRKLTKSSVDLKKLASITSESEKELKSDLQDGLLSKGHVLTRDSSDIIDNSTGLLESDIVVGLNDPVKRQIKLQDINKRSFFDVFFSLHELFNEKPFYISECLTRTSNPIFQDFDLTGYDISHGKFFTIIIWYRTENDQEWKILERFNIKLSFLLYVGDDFDAIVSQFENEKNFLVFKMVNDCYYVLPTPTMSLDAIALLSKNHHKYHQIHQPTCSFDQIMKLNNLQLCIYDSLDTKNILSRSIDEKLKETPYLEIERKALVDRIQNLRKDKEKIRNEISCQREKIDFLRLEMARRNENLNQLENKLPDVMNKVRDQYVSLSNMNMDLKTTLEHIGYEKARIAKVLLDIFKIEPTIDRPFEFQLFNLKFPSKSKSFSSNQSSNHSNLSVHSSQSNGTTSNNSSNNANSFFLNVNIQSLTRTQETEIAALLGYIAQLTVILSYYLQVPLRYPTEPFGCHSYIIDPISKIKGSRMFPLWIKENIIFRFEYGVLLLSKNIDQLTESQGLKSVDKNFLGNLQLLLICLSSDDKEIVSQKKESVELSDIRKKFEGTISRMRSPSPNGKVNRTNDDDNNNTFTTERGEFHNNAPMGEPTTTTSNVTTGAISIPQDNYSEEDNNDLIKNRDRIAVIKKKLSSWNLQRA